jgi:bacillithiol biosynthesis cysteine-adding enzyme BshC
MVRSQDIPFRRIPGHSPLFLDYLDLAPGILRFFGTPPVKQKLEDFACNQFSKRTFPRNELALILERQNALYGAGAALEGQVADLARPDGVAVVTGQQVGVFGGPLYTLYKALTAVALAEELQRSGIRAVPVFWMETEDHDLAEATRVFHPGPSPGTVEVARTLFGARAPSPRPVGSLTLPLKINDVNADYIGSIPESPFRAEVREILERAYAPGVSMTLAFARLLRSLLPELLLFDPADPEAKRLAAPVFLKALEQAGPISAALRNRAGELTAAGYHVQARLREDSTLLFYLSEGERWALDRDSGRFRPRGSGLTFTSGELLRLTEDAPERFSPNVLLRPVVQDTLFPTAAYVAGPSEIAYFAQTGPLYALMERPMPVIWPRNSFTLLDPETAAELERLGIDPGDCLAGRERLWGKNPPRSRELERLEELEQRLDRDLRKIRSEIGAVEAGLERAAANARSKILHNMGRMRARTRRWMPMDQAVDRLLARCLPDGYLQERGAGILPFLARCGSRLIGRLRRETRPENFAHRVLCLGDAPRD